jgi:signal transduction histidine kinase
VEKRFVLGRAALRSLSVYGPAAYLALLAVGVLYYHPHPLPPFWPAFFVLLGLSGAGTFFFSRFVFAHVQGQEDEIMRRSRELADANEAMAVMKERQRIARELHDSLAQSLGYLHLGLGTLERRITDGQVAQAHAELAELRQAARDAYEEARQAIFGLRSMVSRSLGLIPTLTEYLHDWSRRAGIAVDLKVDAEESMTLPPVVEVQLIRIIQEALANVRRHAGARHVLVSIERDREFARVAIRDDGVGFDTPAIAEAGRDRFGMEMMRERAEGVGGKLTFSSSAGRGTTVELQLPLDERGVG